MNNFVLEVGWWYRPRIRKFLASCKYWGSKMRFEEEKGWLNSYFYISNLSRLDLLELRLLIKSLCTKSISLKK